MVPLLDRLLFRVRVKPRPPGRLNDFQDDAESNPVLDEAPSWRIVR